MVNSGLEGIVAAATKLSLVDGERGELVIAGYQVGELAAHATFEETTWLLWHGELPSIAQLESFRATLSAARSLAPATIALLRECARAGLAPMDALRAAAGTISLPAAAGNVAQRAAAVNSAQRADDPAGIVACLPAVVASYWRLTRGMEPIEPRLDLGHAAGFLYMLNGDVPDPERVRGLETYLNTVVDHGLNASTFAARVITSTGSDLVSAVVGALGALKGPLHGGAPGPALDMVFEIGEAARAEAMLRAKIEAGEKLMGFGHRVYKVRDPRADVLAQAAERLFTRAGDMSLYRLARSVEATALRLLEEYKPGRRLQTNVEFYTALLLHGLGLDVTLFTPTFAISRVSGWIAHALEQQRANRIIRPQSEYVGPRDRRWVPLPDRFEIAGVRSG
jgi:citrate synthase